MLGLIFIKVYPTAAGDEDPFKSFHRGPLASQGVLTDGWLTQACHFLLQVSQSKNARQPPNLYDYHCPHAI